MCKPCLRTRVNHVIGPHSVGEGGFRTGAGSGLEILSFRISGGEVLAGLPDALGRRAPMVAAGRDSSGAPDGAVQAIVAGTAVGAASDGGAVAGAGGVAARPPSRGLA